jgi:Flp pilus assembly protein TadG
MMMVRPAATKRPLVRRMVSFARDESGVMAVQVLFFFFMMLLVGGVAVDLMRFEAKRVEVQQTMDRATLAAASLENILVPEDVVNSYFDTAGLAAELKDITVVDTENGRRVRALATVNSDNYFMSMMNVPYLEADSRSQAEQIINDIEIMLVLDVSGSMASQQQDQQPESRRERLHRHRHRQRPRGPDLDRDRALQRPGPDRRPAAVQVHRVACPWRGERRLLRTALVGVQRSGAVDHHVLPDDGHRRRDRQLPTR